MKARLTQSVLSSDGLCSLSGIRLPGGVHGHDPEVVQRSVLQIDHLELGILAGVWGLVDLQGGGRNVFWLFCSFVLVSVLLDLLYWDVSSP